MDQLDEQTDPDHPDDEVHAACRGKNMKAPGNDGIVNLVGQVESRESNPNFETWRRLNRSHKAKNLND